MRKMGVTGAYSPIKLSHCNKIREGPPGRGPSLRGGKHCGETNSGSVPPGCGADGLAGAGGAVLSHCIDNVLFAINR